MQDIVTVLAINAGVILALFVLAWAACVAMRDCTPVDSLWAAGMGVSEYTALLILRHRAVLDKTRNTSF